ncbi:MAG: hypothetical protein ACRDTH_17665 [Pseudonocardiaceae bacterium]
MACTAARQRFDPPSLDYLRTLYQELDRGEHVQIFIAELDGVPVVAELFTGCGGVLTSRLTGMQRRKPVQKSGAAAAVIWYAILWPRPTATTLLTSGVSRRGEPDCRGSSSRLLGEVRSGTGTYHQS